MVWTSRPYAGVEDLRRMQASLAAAFDATDLRVGDLAWLARHRSHRELSIDIRLWEDGGQLIGWTFFRAKGEFNAFVVPGFAEEGLAEEMIASIEGLAREAVAAGDPPVSLRTYAIDPARSSEDRAIAAALERHGFTAAVGPEAGRVHARTLDRLPTRPQVPGYHLTHVSTPAHVTGRVEAQRAAFAPSDLTLEKYERVRRTWPYRPELDRIALTDDGDVVAFCAAWLDEENAAGLLEPVGTIPGHRRRGLAAAVCLDALHALRAAGARTAQVASETDAAAATYASIGFEVAADDVQYRLR